MTPLLSLEQFRSILGWNPFHFWGLANADIPVRAACPTVLKQYAWQNTDAAGRAEISQAIESAESLLRTYLGYAVAPEYREVTVAWPRYYDTNRDRLGWWDATGRWIAPRLPFGFGHIQAAGTELLTLVGQVTVAVASLVFTDSDGDGLSDTFTATIATTQTDADKLAIYFASANRLDSEPVGARWRIEPVKVTITSGVATIIGRIWTIVRPVLYEGVNPQPLDPGLLTASGPYAQALDVYVRTTNPDGVTYQTSQAQLIWETSPVHGWWCSCGCQQASFYAANNDPYDPAAIGSAVGRVTIRDSVTGIVGIGDAAYNTSAGIWAALPWEACHEPDRVTVRVLAGLARVDQQMQRQMQMAVARLAIAELGRPVCACEQANRDIFHWQTDMSRSLGASELFAFISREDLGNPFGPRRGAIWAWHLVRNIRITPGVVGY